MYRREMLNRKMLYCVLVFVFVAVFTMTIAYATLSVTLNIGGAAEIVASNWDIHLENPKVRKGSVSDEVPTITSGNTMNFNVEFDIPGDYYEFTVDVVNDGDIDAMIDNVIKNPELTTEQAKYIKYEITYLNGNSITESQGVPAKSSVPIKVRLEYRNDISSFDDLPSSETTLSLSISLTYIQADETITSVPGGGKVGANGSLDEIGTIVTIGTEQFYVIGTEGENVKLLSMYNLNIGNISNFNEETEQIANPTGLQDSKALASCWTKLDLSACGNQWVGTIEFASSAYWKAEELGTRKYVYDSNSTLYIHFENYKNYIESLGIFVESARPISYEELLAIGCEEYSCEFAPNWVYSTTYWTGTAYSAEDYFDKDINNNMHLVLSGAVIEVLDVYHDYYAGARPVIVVPKYAITGEAIPN